MSYEWLSPVMVGGGVVASYAALRQATVDLKESVDIKILGGINNMRLSSLAAVPYP